MPHPDLALAVALLERLEPMLLDAGLRATLAHRAAESVSLRGTINQCALALGDVADDCQEERRRRDQNEEDQTNASVARWEQWDGVRKCDG